MISNKQQQEEKCWRFREKVWVPWNSNCYHVARSPEPLRPNVHLTAEPPQAPYEFELEPYCVHVDKASSGRALCSPCLGLSGCVLMTFPLPSSETDWNFPIAMFTGQLGEQQDHKNETRNYIRTCLMGKGEGNSSTDLLGTKRLASVSGGMGSGRRQTYVG